MSVLRSQVAGVGAYLPARVVSNAELAQKLETSDEWIRERTGIRERRIAADGECTSDLAIAASQEALRAAGMNAERDRSHRARDRNARRDLPGDRHDGASAPRHHARCSVRHSGRVLRLRLRRRDRRQLHQGRPSQERPRHRRRNLLAHHRLERPHDGRPLRRRRRRDDPHGGARAGRRRRIAAFYPHICSPTAATTICSTSTAVRRRR